jgi:outer membrane protein insertion porin family
VRPPPPPPDAEAVKSIHFDGNGAIGSGRSDFNLRGAINQGENPRLWWLKPRQRRVFLDRETLELDAWRLETWYAHQGYFDATFRGWDVERVSEGKRTVLFWRPDNPASVRIRGEIQERDASLVREVKYKGMKAIGGPLLTSIRSAAPLQAGAPFNLDAMKSSEAMAVDQLQERSFAYATIATDVNVYPAEKAVDVLFQAELGPSCTFGEVTLEYVGSASKDQDLIDEALILGEVTITEGRPYRVSELSKTQRRLFGLGVFSIVNVIPDLSDPESSVVPVHISIAPSKYQQLKTGAGVLVEGGKQDVHVSADYAHVNLFNSLVRMNFDNRLGYATLIQFDELAEGELENATTTSGVTVDSSVNFLVPRVPKRGWDLNNKFRFEQGVEQGYRFRSPTWSPSLRGQLSQELAIEFGYSLSYFKYLELEIERADFDNPLASLDFREEYLLAYLRQQITYDSRNDFFAPTRGQYGIYSVSQAGSFLGSDFNFIKATADHRIYRSLNKFLPDNLRGALAFRLGGGIIETYGNDPVKASVPYQERLYLGGANDVRGWTQDQLGPYICDPSAAAVDCIGTLGVNQAADEIIPIGGLVKGHATAELRLYTTDGYGIVAFYDTGMVWANRAEVWDPSREGLPLALQPSAGGGVRYLLDFAAVRFDVAFRLGDEPMFNQLPGWNFHFSLSEAF